MRHSRAATRLASRLLLACSPLLCPLAFAEPVDMAEQGEYHLSVVAMPQALAIGDFYSSSAGTVTLTSRTFQWGDLLSTLSTNVFLQGAVSVLTLNGTGSLVFDVAAGQYFTTSLFMVAGGQKGYGMSAMDVYFAPSVTEVPLPDGLWLLMGGFALLVALPQRRSLAAGRKRLPD